jgi:cytohesin
VFLFVFTENVVTLLLQRGVNLDAKAGDQWVTALHRAAEGGHEEVVAFLLQKGARPDIGDIHNETPLMWACGRGHVGVVQMLAEHMETHGVGGTAWMGGRGVALRMAACAGHTDVVRFLLGKGAHANDTVRNGDITPLMMACYGGHLGVVQVFIQHMGGRGLDVADVEGRTAMHWAAREGREEVVRALLLAGADPSITDMYGNPPSSPPEWVPQMGVFQVR